MSARNELSESGKLLLNQIQESIRTGDVESRIKFENVLQSTDASIILPQVIIGEMKEAAEPLYIASKFFDIVRLEGSGSSMIFPYVGDMKAEDIPEGTDYPEHSVDFGLLAQRQEIRIGKVGLVVKVTDETIKDSQWDVLGILLRKAGQAMARFKEEKVFRAFRQWGHTVFDNDIRERLPEAGTSGYAFDGTLNNTLSVEDFFDLVLTMMMWGRNPTDVLMHPLTWLVFAKNELVNTLPLAALAGQNNQITISPETVQSRIPFNLTISLTPFIGLDPVARKYDMYVVDRDNVGVILVRDDLSTEQFTDPRRDLRAIKVRERYGVGILHDGKGIAVAKNIALAKSYNMPERYISLTSWTAPPEL